MSPTRRSRLTLAAADGVCEEAQRARLDQWADRPSYLRLPYVQSVWIGRLAGAVAGKRKEYGIGPSGAGCLRKSFELAGGGRGGGGVLFSVFRPPPDGLAGMGSCKGILCQLTGKGGVRGVVAHMT